MSKNNISTTTICQGNAFCCHGNSYFSFTFHARIENLLELGESVKSWSRQCDVEYIADITAQWRVQTLGYILNVYRQTREDKRCRHHNRNSTISKSERVQSQQSQLFITPLKRIQYCFDFMKRALHCHLLVTNENSINFSRPNDVRAPVRRLNNSTRTNTKCAFNITPVNHILLLRHTQWWIDVLQCVIFFV